MGKGTREELDALLERAWEGQKKRQKWAEAHPAESAEEAVANKKKSESESDVRPTTRYIRRVLPGILLGIASVIPDPNMFWWRAGFIIVGLVLFILDVVLEPLEKWRKGVAITLLVVLLSFFLYTQVFISAPLAITVNGLPVEDKDNDGKVGGMEWKTSFYEVKISIQDPVEDLQYTDIYLKVSSSEQAIAKMSQTTNVSGVTLTPRIQDVTATFLDKDRKPLLSRSMDVMDVLSYTIECNKLRNGNLLIFVVAFERVDFRGNVLPKSKPSSIQIHGTYEAGGRIRHIDEKIPVVVI